MYKRICAKIAPAWLGPATLTQEAGILTKLTKVTDAPLPHFPENGKTEMGKM